MARTHLKLFQDTLDESFGHQRAALGDLAEVLGDRWDAAQVEKKAREFDRVPAPSLHPSCYTSEACSA